MAAANNGHLGMVDVLLQKGVNPDMQDHVSYTCILDCMIRPDCELTFQTGWTALMAAVLKDYHDVALRIIEAGATPHIQDHVRSHPMF